MSLFRKSSVRQPEPVVINENDGSHPFFARRNKEVASPATTNSSGGLFSSSMRKNSNESAMNSPTSSNGHHFFSKGDSLTTARNKLHAAIKAEKDADEALIASRLAVKSAKAEIANLEREAKEEARLAKIKVDTASRFRKAGDKLGKH